MGIWESYCVTYTVKVSFTLHQFVYFSCPLKFNVMAAAGFLCVRFLLGRGRKIDRYCDFFRFYNRFSLCSKPRPQTIEWTSKS